MNLIFWLTIPVLLVTLLYVTIQLNILKWWLRGRQHETLLLSNKDDLPFVSVIVAARNEECNINACLKSLSCQDIPAEQFEVILVNDHSEDDTIGEAQSANLTNLSIHTLPKGLQGKKDAIRFGITKSTGVYLLFTDADCILPKSWIQRMRNHMLMGNLDAVCAPISFKLKEQTILQIFQWLDNMGMMAVSAAAINGNYFSMANGANLGLKRSILAGKNIEWNNKFASGDDMALIGHVRKENGQIAFVHDPEVIVITETQPTWTDFLNQRLRWGTKNKSSHQPLFLFVVGMVFFAALSHVIALIILPFYILGMLTPITPFLWMCVFLKPTIDTIVLHRISPFFNVRFSNWKLFFLSIMHSFYIFLVGSLSLFRLEYPWKGRRLR